MMGKGSFLPFIIILVKHGASCTKMAIYNCELIYNDRDLFVYFPSILLLEFSTLSSDSDRYNYEDGFAIQVGGVNYLTLKCC